MRVVKRCPFSSPFVYCSYRHLKNFELFTLYCDRVTQNRFFSSGSLDLLLIKWNSEVSRHLPNLISQTKKKKICLPLSIKTVWKFYSVSSQSGVVQRRQLEKCITNKKSYRNVISRAQRPEYSCQVKIKGQGNTVTGCERTVVIPNGHKFRINKAGSK